MDASVSPSVAETFESEVRSTVGADHVHVATDADAVVGRQPRMIVEPGSEQELAKVLKLANAAQLTVIPRGGGSKLHWGNRASRADLMLSTARLNRVLEHAWADLTVSVEAGCTIQKLQETLAKHGQRLALDPLWPERATVGGVLSTNDSGVLRLRFGSLRDLVIGATIALADGTLASSGGKVVKNVAGYDLPKLVTGALGTLGVITRAIFRLHPLPRGTRTISCPAGDFGEAQRIMLAIQNSTLAHSALQIGFGAEVNPRVDILFEGVEAGLTAQAAQLKSMLRDGAMNEGKEEVWGIRQLTYPQPANRNSNAVVAKFAVLPARLAETLSAVAKAAEEMRWSGVAQATGIGCVRIEGAAPAVENAIRGLRTRCELEGGSLVIEHRGPDLAGFDAWGKAGDALPLMKAVKRQFDPRNTLNPGRFAGGI